MTIYIGKKLRFELPGERERVLKAMRGVIAALTALAVITGAACLVLWFLQKGHTLELGDSLSASDILGEDAVFGADYDPSYIEKPGVYYFTVIKNGKERQVRLSVVDTRAPQVTVKDIKCGVGGPYPKVTDFIDTVSEAGELQGEFVTPLPEMKSFDTYEAQVRFFDESGNKTEIFDVKVTLIYDNTAPKITLLCEEVIYTGTALDYNALVTLSDDCAGELTLTVDDSEVIWEEPDEYKVYLLAEDAVGNQSEKVILTVIVPEPEMDAAG